MSRAEAYQTGYINALEDFFTEAVKEEFNADRFEKYEDDQVVQIQVLRQIMYRLRKVMEERRLIK